MEQAEDCIFDHLLADGTPLVMLRGGLREIAIHGVEIPQPPSQTYIDLMTQRLPRLARPLRCVYHREEETGRLDATLLYYGWLDKSGDVWLDLAVLLLDQGLVRVQPADFPEREDYLQHQRDAQARGAGIWSGSLKHEQER